ncbi:MAG: molecular chaperone HtpG [Gammaproteobacteria bacterium]
MSTEPHKEIHGFEAEVGKVLDIVINSLYSNKEIFLRELISNASDAIDKLRFLALTDSALYENDSDLKIHVAFDKAAHTITITDNGIGMTREEVMQNLGTIAKSGTKEFLQTLSGDAKKDSNLIGQFGVGFYSAFIVADNVTVRTRKAGLPIEQGVEWQSQGDGKFTIENIEKTFRGTEIILNLRNDEEEFLEEYRLRNIITKYSDHIAWPIVMEVTEYQQEGEGENAKSVEKQVEKTVNQATALWTLPKNDIKDEEYTEFYKHIGHDFEDPLAWIHNRVEGAQNYISLLYIPQRAPFDLWYQEAQHGLKLYVQRVFIMDKAEQFLPRYLRFVKGVVDANDLPLNVSRELLQNNKVTNAIRSGCTKKILDLLEKLAQDDTDKYAKFWEQFGQVLKEGTIEDFSNKERIAKLLRFASTHNDNDAQNISLQDYVSRMVEGQDKIYYITADNYTAAKNSPHLEIFRKKGIEVLLLSDRIDDWLVSHVTEFEGKKLQSITKGDLDLGGMEDKEVKEKYEKASEAISSAVEQIKKVLGDKVKDVRTTYRLTDSPACIVADENDMNLQMQRILEAAGQKAPASKPILEINPEHPLIIRLKEEQDDERFGQWSHILLDQAILAEGGQLEDSANFVSRLNKMLLQLMA